MWNERGCQQNELSPTAQVLTAETKALSDHVALEAAFALKP